jgi:hypothetical protein
LDKSNYQFTKIDANVWTIKFTGKSLKDFHVILTTTPELIIIGSVVARKQSLKMTTDLMRTLLQQAHGMDRVKVGFDTDGDVFARVEVSARVFDSVELGTNVEQVAAATDSLHASIKSFLLAGNQ